MPTKLRASHPSDAINRVAAKPAEHAQPLASNLDQAWKAGSRRIKLTELMAQFNREHRQGECDLGDPVGDEVW